MFIFISRGLHSTQPSTQPITHASDAWKLARRLRRCIACNACILMLAMTHDDASMVHVHMLMPWED